MRHAAPPDIDLRLLRRAMINCVSPRSALSPISILADQSTTEWLPIKTNQREHLSIVEVAISCPEWNSRYATFRVNRVSAPRVLINLRLVCRWRRRRRRQLCNSPGRDARKVRFEKCALASSRGSHTTIVVVRVSFVY
jgi:hypothetical protein